jgi:CHAD domain-containing protein
MAVFESIYDYYLHQLLNCGSYIEQCKVHAEPELVHQLRLSIKKLRAFKLLADRLEITGIEEYQQLIDGVKNMFKLAGQIRDTQVQIYMLASSKEQTGIGYTLFQKWLLRREKMKILQLCGSKYKSSIDSDSESAINGIPKTSLLPEKATIISSAQNLLDEMYVKTQILATGSIGNENLHEIRKVVKQMRYINNILTGIYPEFHYHRITPEELKDIENAVGNWHDNLIRIEFIERFMKKIKNRDEVIVLKYKGLAEFSHSSLDEAYGKACQVVKSKLLG